MRESVDKEFKSLVINKSTPIASIGTCFAEEFSRYMKSSGNNYLCQEENIFDSSANWGRVYTIPNLLNIVEYSLLESTPFYIEKCKKGYFDPLRDYSTGYFDTNEEALQSLKKHRDASKKVFIDSNVLVITLGQNEGWFDKKNRITWGTLPPQDIYNFDKSRFQAVEYNFTENVTRLKLLINLIKKNNVNIQIIFTVSPVPSYATFIDNSVITQSFAGKCLLRSVIHEVKKDFPDVYYFPSFEIVLCKNPKSFIFDNRHIMNTKIREIFSVLKEILK